MMLFPIIDAHLHLWDDSNLSYPWLTSIAILNRSYLLSDLMAATKSLHVESFIFIQSGCEESQSMAEVNWVTELAKRDTRIRGIIAHAPLQTGNEIRPYLEALKNNKLVKGVRYLLLAEKNDFCLQEKFIEGVKCLAEF